MCVHIECANAHLYLCGWWTLVFWSCLHGVHPLFERCLATEVWTAWSAWDEEKPLGPPVPHGGTDTELVQRKLLRLLAAETWMIFFDRHRHRQRLKSAASFRFVCWRIPVLSFFSQHLSTTFAWITSNYIKLHQSS